LCLTFGGGVSPVHLVSIASERKGLHIKSVIRYVCVINTLCRMSLGKIKVQLGLRSPFLCFRPHIGRLSRAQLVIARRKIAVHQLLETLLQ
jgi:hypothetical protein